MSWAVMPCSVLSTCSTSRDKAPGGSQCSGCCSWGSCGCCRGTAGDELLRRSRQREVGCRQAGAPHRAFASRPGAAFCWEMVTKSAVGSPGNACSGSIPVSSPHICLRGAGWGPGVSGEKYPPREAGAPCAHAACPSGCGLPGALGSARAGPGLGRLWGARAEGSAARAPNTARPYRSSAGQDPAEPGRDRSREWSQSWSWSWGQSRD